MLQPGTGQYDLEDEVSYLRQGITIRDGSRQSSVILSPTDSFGRLHTGWEEGQVREAANIMKCPVCGRVFDDQDSTALHLFNQHAKIQIVQRLLELDRIKEEFA